MYLGLETGCRNYIQGIFPKKCTTPDSIEFEWLQLRFSSMVEDTYKPSQFWLYRGKKPLPGFYRIQGGAPKTNSVPIKLGPMSHHCNPKGGKKKCVNGETRKLDKLQQICLCIMKCSWYTQLIWREGALFCGTKNAQNQQFWEGKRHWFLGKCWSVATIPL